MPWRDWTRALNDALADLYPTVSDSRRVVACAGLNAALVRFNDAALVNWFNIIDEARKQGDKQLDILTCALSDYPEHVVLNALKRGEPPTVQSPEFIWKSRAVGMDLEAITGSQSTLLPISFLEIGMMKSRAVARIVRADGSSGTGFLIGGGWLLTNNHVLQSPEIASGAMAEFNYQLTTAGLATSISRHRFDVSRFLTSAKNDWTVVGMSRPAEEEWGCIRLEPAKARIADFVNIIQHPAGGPKQIALFHNTVTYVGERRVQYLTDTLPGSSGSPVFNQDWKIVAVHHSGGMLREPGTKLVLFRNEGIDINTVIDDLSSAGLSVANGSTQI